MCKEYYYPSKIQQHSVDVRTHPAPQFYSWKHAKTAGNFFLRWILLSFSVIGL